MANTYQPKGFKYGFFDCCGNVGDCLFACVLPDCYAFVAAQDAGEDTMCAILQCCCYPLGLCFLRSNAREKRGIDGSFVEDVLASCCCPCCTAIQIRREFRE